MKKPTKINYVVEYTDGSKDSFEIKNPMQVERFMSNHSEMDSLLTQPAAGPVGMSVKLGKKKVKRKK